MTSERQRLHKLNMVESPGSPATLRTATWSIRWFFVAVDKSMLTYAHSSHPLRSMSREWSI